MQRSDARIGRIRGCALQQTAAFLKRVILLLLLLLPEENRAGGIIGNRPEWLHPSVLHIIIIYSMRIHNAVRAGDNKDFDGISLDFV